MLFAVIPISLLLFQAALQRVYAKCCHEDYWATCGDGTHGTPCCGYKTCNGFCCACQGVEIIREVVYSYQTSPTYHTYKWTSVITAPAGTTWTCRASHLTTTDPPPQLTSVQAKREEPTKIRLRVEIDLAATVTKAPHTILGRSTAPPPYNAQMLADLKETFTHVCGGRTHNGANVVNLDDYYGYFNVTADQKGTDFAKSVRAKFHTHDINGDGFLTMDEAELLCDSNGCT
ncbi:hypothetical protein H2200_012402 [Cladophialophora chaetospira]|uniref:EF-hand domain-containing protein n=1 Tax=Cladophialophora chaetospira TaxID=386627 RepID=A0AA38WXV8_9EURO|nr:hypothetical protein H2200_012402 [Cladophialophora chaetospira]